MAQKEQWLQSPEVHNSWKNFWLNLTSKFHRKRSWAGPSLNEVFVSRAPPRLVGSMTCMWPFHKSELPRPLGTKAPLSPEFSVCFLWSVGSVTHTPLPGPSLPTVCGAACASAHTALLADTPRPVRVTHGLGGCAVSGAEGAVSRGGSTVPPPQPACPLGLKVLLPRGLWLVRENGEVTVQI